MTRKAMIVWGGWAGHDPDLCASIIRGWLRSEGLRTLAGSLLVCAALGDLLATVDLPAWRDAVAGLREALLDGLVAAGLAPEPSDACWVLVEAPGLREVLAPRGVAVRDCTSFGLPGHVRIAVPDPAGLDRLLEALP